MNLSDEQLPRFISKTVHEACASSSHPGVRNYVDALTEMAVRNIRKEPERDPDVIRHGILRSIARIDTSATALALSSIDSPPSELLRDADRLLSGHFDSDGSFPQDTVKAAIGKLWCTIWPFCSPG
ncbi:MAG: hypothetical protein AB7D39_13205 [Pseudodesulfovibrio sp.]|uniref:hypothetical protein n=1 Tax=Pseudodesulfovibrio sp. TaxID=2035812 RepID=UPI003D11E9D1